MYFIRDTIAKYASIKSREENVFDLPSLTM